MVCMVTVHIQDLKYFLDLTHMCGFSVLIYWCDCTVQSLFLF